MISNGYRAMLAESHEKNPRWGTSAGKHSEVVSRLIFDMRAQTVLDYGCGKGVLKKSLPARIETHKYSMTEYDPAIKGKDCAPTDDFDLVCCIDVLEHIEPDHLDAVLSHLKQVTGWMGYFLVSTRKAVHILPDGRNAHLIVKGPEWWGAKMGEHFTNFSACINAGRSEVIFLVAGSKYEGGLPDLKW